MKDFFISYNAADREWAEWIAWQLEEAGYSLVLQAWDFRPGSNFALEMHSAAQAAERTIAVLSPDFLHAEYTKPEWAAAFASDPTSKQGRLLPIRVRPCDLTGLLKTIVYLDLVGLDRAAATRTLLEGVERGRRKPSREPEFPDAARESTPDRPTVQDTRVRLLHLSDLWIGFTRDRSMHREILASVKRDIIDDALSSQGLDAVIVSGDIAFTARREDYVEAESFLNELGEALGVDPQNDYYLVPGNHDVDWTSIGPGDRHIVESIAKEEEIARIMSHAPTMELLGARFANFCAFTKNFLGRSRAWRRDRPWRVDKREFTNHTLGFLQLNTAWSLGPENANHPKLGLYPVNEALTEAAGCDVRFWVMHHPLNSLHDDEADRIYNLFASHDGQDVIFRGTRHADDSSLFDVSTKNRGFLELAAGPMFPGLVDPLCTVLCINVAEQEAESRAFQYDRRHRRWKQFTDSADQPQRLCFSTSFLAQANRAPTDTRLTRRPTDISEHTVAQSSNKKETSRPNVRIVDESELRASLTQRPVLIICAVEVELRAVLDRLKPLPKKRTVWKGHVGQETYYIGRYGAEQVVVTMCGMGTMGRDSVILAAQQGFPNSILKQL